MQLKKKVPLHGEELEVHLRQRKAEREAEKERQRQEDEARRAAEVVCAGRMIGGACVDAGFSD
jgi:serine phosphatase RsbU (regulator of sigma subunit)